MTSKIVVNNIEADTGISTITFINEVTAPTFNGNITGTAATFTTGTFSGNVDIAGALTYEDVTNVDSVGIITAQAGIRVTGGNVKIGPAGNPGFGAGSGLEVERAGAATIRIEDTSSSSSFEIQNTGGVIKQRLYNNQPWSIEYGSGEKLRITSAGLVGIGTDNPVGNLEIRDSKANLIVAKDGLTVKSNSDLATQYDLIQLGAGGALASYSTATATADTQFIHNAYRHSGGQWKYRYADTAMRFRMNSPGNTFIFESAANGSADADITFSEKLRITSAGDLFVAGTGGMNTTQLPNGSTININGNSSNDGFSIIRYSAGYGAYGLNIGRSKSGTVGTNAIVSNGNDLGHITFYGADGSSYLKASQITAQVDGTPSAGSDMPGRLVFKTSSDGSATPTERLRIGSNGFVGINETSPGAQLTVKRANTSTSGLLGVLKLKQGSATNGNRASILFSSLDDFDVAAVNGVIETHAGSESNNKGRLEFYTKNSGSSITERMRIGSNGRVDIGNELGVAHAGVLQVIHTGGGQQDNDALAFFETNANDWIIMTNYNSSGTHYHMRFQAQGSVKGAIYGSSGADVQYAGSSDYRLKENIVEITGTQGIDICKKLKPSYFNWIENRIQTGETNTVDGFIAHEVQEAGLLGVVSGEKDAVNEDGSINGQMMDYGKMTPVLSAAIKGLIDKVETLETQNASLEARLTTLEG